VYPDAETTKPNSTHKLTFVWTQRQNGMSVQCKSITQREAEILSPAQGGVDGIPRVDLVHTFMVLDHVAMEILKFQLMDVKIC
jgi:hypothetical protein